MIFHFGKSYLNLKFSNNLSVQRILRKFGQILGFSKGFQTPKTLGCLQCHMQINTSKFKYNTGTFKKQTAHSNNTGTFQYNRPIQTTLGLSNKILYIQTFLALQMSMLRVVNAEINVLKYFF
jgi:hypothetical protein